MTVLHLVRHAETVWHLENRYAGRSDVPLSARGREQAQQLAAWASNNPLNAVYCSNLTRSRDTAQPSSIATGLRLNVDVRLTEADFGLGEGMTSGEMTQRFPDERTAFVHQPATSPLPHGEPGAVVATRMVAALRDIARHESGPVLVVGHSTAIRLALCHLIGVSLDAYRTVFPRLGNVAITTIELSTEHDATAALHSLNVPIDGS